MIQGQSVQEPSLIELLNRAKTEVFKSLNICKPGTIVSYNATKGTASIQICYKRELYDGSVAGYPLLVDCPVVTIQGGGIHFKAPIMAGDECLVFFADSNIDLWFQNGGQEVPFDGRRHSLSDGFALVGINHLAASGTTLKTLLAADEGGIAGEQVKVALKGSKVNISNQTQSLLTALDLFLTGLTPSTLASQAAALKISIDALFY